MGKCLRKCLCLPTKNNELKIFNILILGLSGVGKTEIGHAISGEKRNDYSNTNGVRKFTRKFDDIHCVWNLTEIGGSSDMQKIWHHYFIRAIAIIYIIDVSDLIKINHGFNTLSMIVKNKYISGKPILIVVNKVDLKHHVDLNELEDVFRLESLANSYKSPMLLIENHMFDLANFHRGLNWLQGKLMAEYRHLNNRIKFDSDFVKFQKFNNELLKTVICNTSRPSTAPSRLNKITQNKFKNIRLRRVHAEEILPNNDNNTTDNIYNNVNNKNIIYKMDKTIINSTLPATSVTVKLNSNNNSNNETNVEIVTIERMKNYDEENCDISKINNNNNKKNGFCENISANINNENFN